MRPPLRLDAYAAPVAPRAVVLFLHGGQESNTEPVLDKHASWWRIAAMARRLRPWATSHDLATYLLQYRVRGWNDPANPSPVPDAFEALETLRERHPGLPIVVVGHSMGGRTACRVARDPAVVGVVGLAPWLPEGEPVEGVRGRHVRLIHGTRDSWTSAPLSRAWAERAQPVAASVEWTSLPGVGHFMFRKVRRWNGFVRASVEDIVTLTSPPSGADHERPASEDAR